MTAVRGGKVQKCWQSEVARALPHFTDQMTGVTVTSDWTCRLGGLVGKTPQDEYGDLVATRNDPAGARRLQLVRTGTTGVEVQ